ncbi:MAG: nitrophenyl compound nitroreductase subunit ArsF family protein [Ginsengibacter sp.]
MTKSIFTTVLMTVLLLLGSYNSNGQNTKKENAISSTSTIQIIQFHSEHRCMTCNLIEKLTRETLQKYPAISFTLINVDDKKNGKMAEQFEATGTALFLYNPTTRAKKNLTDFAFMNARSDAEKFKDGLEKEIKAFK